MDEPVLGHVRPEQDVQAVSLVAWGIVMLRADPGGGDRLEHHAAQAVAQPALDRVRASAVVLDIDQQDAAVVGVCPCRCGRQ
jgi:hypothetical protein